MSAATSSSPPAIRRWLRGRALAVLLAVIAAPGAMASTVAPSEVIAALKKGQALDVVIEYESSDVDAEITSKRRPGDHMEDRALTDLRSQRYASIKAALLPSMSKAGVEAVLDYSHLPMATKRLRTAAALNALMAEPRVKAIYPNRSFHRVGTANLNLVAQPATAAVGYVGAGATVAVLDDGITYTSAAFGGCTAPGTPAGCMVSVSRNFGTGTTDTSHGTNVSAIIAGMAPSARIAMLNVFSGSVAYTADILSAFNWAIKNKSAYNIVAINMSLGDGGQNTAPCASNNPYLTPTSNAQKVGITVVAAAGNDAFSNALNAPACTPGVVSVGAVYTASYGGFTWGNNLCTDYATSADTIACFSDSASFMTLWAPGAMITAGGITEGGTSQASPHVAGAVAVLRSAFPGDTLATTLGRLTSSRTWITDSRNGQTKPRLDLETAARPANDDLASRNSLTGSSGTAAGSNRLATLESGEKLIDTQSSGHSVWWKWVAPASGQLSLHTHGSSFDTVLAVLTGNTPASLQTIAWNDDDGSADHTSSLLFQTTAGTEYLIEVDGAGGTQGDISLNWSLNTTAQANLALSGPSGPSAPPLGGQANYTVVVSNAGPQSATNVRLTLSLPDGVSLISSSVACQGSTGDVSCALGTMSSGSQQSLDFLLNWNVSTTRALTASVTSDVPDSSTSNNGNSVQITASADMGDTVDAPTLPQWSAIALAGLLLLMMAYEQGLRRG